MRQSVFFFILLTSIVSSVCAEFENNQCEKQTFYYTSPRSGYVVLGLASVTFATVISAWAIDQYNIDQKIDKCSVITSGTVALFYYVMAGLGLYRGFFPDPPKTAVRVTDSYCELLKHGSQVKIKFKEVDAFDILGDDTLAFLLNDGAIYTIKSEDIDDSVQAVNNSLNDYYKH